jgi:methionyl-tRNA synthetase
MQPWALAKDPARRGRLDTVLWTLAEGLRALGILLDPFLPDAAAKIRDAIGQPRPTSLAEAEWGRLAPGSPVRKVAGLFPRVVEGADTARADHGKASERAETGTGQITIDEFARLDLRVAEVVAAEAMPKSKKLLKLTVALGEETRTVMAGIAEHYAPADLVGKKVVVVANLQPAKLMGVESRGMVLAGSTDGALAVITLDRDLPPGSRVK